MQQSRRAHITAFDRCATGDKTRYTLLPSVLFGCCHAEPLSNRAIRLVDRLHVELDHQRAAMVIPANFTIARLPHLGGFLAETPRAVAGWGRKRSGQRAMRWARWLNRPLALVEDGFIRSVARSDPPISLIIDSLGVYYDATATSGMEAAIAAGVNQAEADRAGALAAAWRAGAVSKYNHAPECLVPLPIPYVLVVDQTWGDLSVTLGLADQSSFCTMLDVALAENPTKAVLVKVHPDVFSQARRGWLQQTSLAHPRITVIGSDCHAAGLLQGADKVYAVTSLMGFEALLWEKPVRCFGMPFYAGWGLTSDQLPAPARRGAATLAAVVHAALIGQARYIDPVSGQSWQVEDAIAHVAEARRRCQTSVP